ncbi:MAG TPA: sugar transferase [Oligoflexus sp.]|uniref:sugar transferase n=1 Tax=Oligoflexus sp. TaxID=1971216 RepID=UPI002D243885|nr:sugar transferase [Oligoflexus sp.]HYX35618.1 sugar transferase [Oligoflexus sp.]
MAQSTNDLSLSNAEVFHPVFVDAEMSERRRSSRPTEEEAITGQIGPGGLPQKKYSYLSNSIKRFIDLSAAVVGLILLTPILAVIALLIKTTSKGPVFFIQKRVGMGGTTFKMYKFRTMVLNAEELKSQLMAQNEVSGPVFKIKRDPRVTAIGRFLRKTSLDELPQLLNVVLNDMSLVGPRPPLMDEVVKYRQWQTRRLSVKPGITCIWQVSGRNQVTFDEWVRMDLRYIEKRSLFLDLVLLVKTLKVVFIRPDGA